MLVHLGCRINGRLVPLKGFISLYPLRAPFPCEGLRTLPLWQNSHWINSLKSWICYCITEALKKTYVDFSPILPSPHLTSGTVTPSQSYKPMENMSASMCFFVAHTHTRSHCACVQGRESAWEHVRVTVPAKAQGNKYEPPDYPSRNSIQSSVQLPFPWGVHESMCEWSLEDSEHLKRHKLFVRDGDSCMIPSKCNEYSQVFFQGLLSHLYV